MPPELEDLAQRRDYRLAIVWGCSICYPKARWDKVGIFLHRTNEEYKQNKSNVNQKCGQGHITKPIKQCSKCYNTYVLEDFSCPVCDKYIYKLTEIEMKIEEQEKNKIRYKTQLKKGKMQKDAYVLLIFDTDELILKFKTARDIIVQEDQEKKED